MRPSPIIAPILLLAGLFVTPPVSQAQVPDSIVRRLMSDHSVPGLSLAVVRGEAVDLYSWGIASQDPTDLVTPDTPFRIASVAKPLVAATVLTQARARGIDLHTDVEDLIGFPLDPAPKGPVTLHHLLTHTAGFDERMIGYAARSSDEMRPLGEYLAERMPDRGWVGGDIVSYSNHGMSLAAYAVEEAAGESFAKVASSSLFVPLGMTSTLFLEGGGQLPSAAAQPLVCHEGECTVRAHVFSHAYPAGLAFSTARDMGRFIESVLGSQKEGGPLAGLIPPRFSHDARLPGMSYGFFNQSYRGHRVIAHSGSTGGYWALLLMVPDEDVGFFLAANGGSSDFGRSMRDGLLPLLLGPASPPSLKPNRLEDPAVHAGGYELTRYSHRTVERLPQLFHNSITLAASGDTLLVYSGGRRDPYLQVEDSLYQGVENGDLLAFGTRQGEPYLFRSSDVYGAALPAAYEKRSRIQRSHFMNEYLSWIMALPLMLLGILWPLLASLDVYLRKRRHLPHPTFKMVQLSTTLSMTGTAFLFFWFGFAFIARSNRMLESGEMLFGMPSALAGVLWMPYAHGALTGLLTLGLPFLWQRKWWGLSRRLVITVVVGCLLLQSAFLIQWNYLPPAW